MPSDIIYFDYNATHPVFPEVCDAMLDVLSSPYNPSSMHAMGRKGKALLDSVRKSLCGYFGISSNDYLVIFTSGGTESNNLALRCVKPHVITLATEHSSVFNVVGQGVLEVDKQGIIKLDVLHGILSHYRDAGIEEGIVSIALANGETGVIQPLKEVAAIVHEYGWLLHSDCVQALGKIEVNLADLGIDLVSVSAHKIGGPQGVGALICRKGIEVQPLFVGGGQELRMRSGTQNVAGIVGFGKALQLVSNSSTRFAEVENIRNFIERELTECAKNSIVFSSSAKRLPNVANITMPNVPSETQVIYFDTNSVCVSAGSACSSGKVELPRVQMSMGYSEVESRTALRISLGVGSTMDEAKIFCDLWKDLYRNTNKLNNAV